jgi:imidazole glycerol-phosphate synthase subunit HisH
LTIKVSIVDYGMGNIRSVHNAFERLGCSVTSTADPDDLASADALILPGVGAFGEAVAHLNARQLISPILRAVNEQKKPLLGICLGMQLLAEASEERGHHAGLGLIPGRVRKLSPPKDLRVPHVGWNSVTVKRAAPLFAHARDGDAFYFVHSYHFDCSDEYIAATTDYGSDVVAAVQRERVFGVQFHPERSQSKGLALLGNFVSHVKRLTGKDKTSC